MADNENIYSVGDSGQAEKITPEIAQELSQPGGGGVDPDKFISPEQAQRMTQHEADVKLAERDPAWLRGVVGVGQGATMGLSTPLLIKTVGAFSDPQGEALARHSLAGYADTPANEIGKLAGLAAGTYLMPGGTAIENGVTRLMPEATGILGSAAKSAVSMGARGAYEGAIAGLGNAVEDASIQNRPLTAEALLIGMGEGSALGFGIGGAIGGTSSLASSAKDSVAKALSSRAESNLLSKLGVGKTTVERMAESPGGVAGSLKDAHEMLDREGLGLASNPAKLKAVASDNFEKFSKLRVETAGEFDKAATGSAPRWSRFVQEVKNEIVAPTALAPGGLERSAEVDAWLKKAAPKASVGDEFTNWAKGRDLIAKTAQRLPEEDAHKVLFLYDQEMKQAMASAEAIDPTLKGAAGRYSAAETGRRTAEVIQDIVSSRAHPTVSSHVDLGGAVGVLASGHPVSALGYTLARTAYKGLSERLGPQVAEGLWRMSIGAKAGTAVAGLKGAVERGVTSFLRSKSTLPVIATKIKLSRASYNKESDRALAAVQVPRADRFKHFLQESGNLQMAEQMTKLSDNALQMTQAAIPAKRGMTTNLRPVPTPEGLNVNEHAFVRTHGIVKSPLSIFSDLEEGRVSKDTVDSLKQAWPETYQLIANEVKMQVAQLKADGKPVPMDKVTQLSILLGQPLDTTLEPDFISMVQTALNTSYGQQQQQSQQQQSAPAQVEDYRTPSEANEANS